MPQVTIDNPILNGPFSVPTRHFRFDDDGITNDIVEKRRRSAYFVPIARPRKRGAQRSFETEWTGDRVQENSSYNGESFFVRHAYFTGADEPYEKLKRALRAEKTRRRGPRSTSPAAARSLRPIRAASP